MWNASALAKGFREMDRKRLVTKMDAVIPMVGQFGAHSKNIRAQSLTVKSSRDSTLNSQPIFN